MRKRKICARIVLSAVVFVFLAGVGQAKTKTFRAFCWDEYEQSGKCPADICQLFKPEGVAEEVKGFCLPVKCTELSAEQCPADYCVVMENCSQEKICHFPMEGGKPKCGDLAYAGQDVPCCRGLTQRCGIEFIDATCDMEGENSVYSLPICIPCGDGICGNFENRCNCPEDCGKAPQTEDGT